VYAHDLRNDEIDPINAHLLRNLVGAHSLASLALRATSVARTWIDLAAEGTSLDAIMAGDSIVHRRLATVDELRAAASVLTRGSARARALNASANLNPQRETAIESLAWVRFHEWGLPAPLMQVDIRDDRGHVGRVDFLWPEHRLIVEVDGRVKYRDEAELWREKAREDRLRALGYRVIRCTWAELMDPHSPVRALLRRILHLAA
jgi:very-short-patch-repair endonuclease